MNVAVESDGARISLKSGKQHFTLYSSDLEHLWKDDFEAFYEGVVDYLLDVMPDEGYGDWSWKPSDLKKACQRVHKTLKR